GGRTRRVGFDYVHVAVDDHSRVAFAQILPDEKGTTCAAFLLAAAEFFADHGVTISRVMTDNALNYRRSADFQAAIATLGAKHVLTRPHCPWQNGKAERFNRTMQENWAYRHPFTSNTARAPALAAWLKHYTPAGAHTARGGKPPTCRLPRACRPSTPRRCPPVPSRPAAEQLGSAPPHRVGEGADPLE